MGKPLRVLIVEDFKADALLLARHLDKAGFDVRFERVETAKSMRAALKGKSWDVILCDYKLPEFSPAAALELMWAAGLDLPFIVVSGTIGEEYAADLMRAGAHDLILKDNLARIVPAIEREMREAEVRRKRKQAEKALRESEERFRSLFEGSSQGIVVDQDLKPLQVNAKLAKILGYGSPDEILALPSALELYAQDERTRLENYHAKLLRGKSVREDFRIRGMRKDGSEIWLNSRPFLIDWGDGPAVCAAVYDITEQVTAEAQLIQAAKLATLGEMATSVAHELNQPLNVIRMAAGNVMRRLEKGDADAAYLNEKLERITSQTARAAAIIDHMRMFGRKAEAEPAELDPGDTLRDTVQLMSEQLRLAEIEVSEEIPETCRPILGHKVQMEQVLLNLLTNARDAIEGNHGERKITLAVDDTAADTVRIVVGDTGGGIPDEAMARLFEPFYTTKETGEGTGLGLSVSYGIIRDMGGTIVAENAEGGARFTVTLPVAEEAAEALTPEA